MDVKRRGRSDGSGEDGGQEAVSHQVQVDVEQTTSILSLLNRR